ncbi:MAG: hypothetical protein AAB880_00885, partial [Patescibacteria group bacterium]
MNLIKTSQKKIAKSAKTLGAAMSLKSYRKLAINFLILTVNLVIIVLYFTLSQATISIIPKKEKIKHEASIPLLDINGRTATTTVEIAKKITVQAGIEVPAQARGQVTIYNKTAARNQQLISTTRLSSPNGIIIRLAEGITIKPGEAKIVNAYADIPGPEGEVAPGQFEIVALKSDKDKIYGEVTAAFTGGTTLSRAVSQATLDKAKAELEIALRKLALAKLQESEPGITEKDIAINITEFTASAKIGAEASEFTAQAKAEAKALVYDASAAEEYLVKNLTASLTPNKILARVDSKTFTATPNAQGTELSASIEAYLQPKMPEAIFDKKAIIGLNQKEVETYFKKITGI